MCLVNSLAVFGVITSILGGAVTSTKSLDESSVTEDLSAISSFKSSDYPQLKAYEHVEAVGGDFRALTVSDGADSFSKLYVYLYHPSGAKLGYWDSKSSAYSSLSGYRFRMSFSGAYDSYFLASAKLLSASSDNLFLKFRIDYQFPFTSKDSERGYDLSAFEILGGHEDSGVAMAVSDSYALGDRFVLSGSGSSLDVAHQVMDVVTLQPGFFGYRFDAANSHTGDSYQWVTSVLGYPTEKATCYTDLFSCGFHFSPVYGDLVGLRMSWLMEMFQGSTSRWGDTAPHLVSSDRRTIDYTDSDRLNVASQPKGLLDAFKDIGLLAFVKTDWYAPEIPVIEKIDKTKILALSSDNDPYYVGQAGADWYKKEFASAPGDDFYVIHYDVRDECHIVKEVNKLAAVLFFWTLPGALSLKDWIDNNQDITTWAVDDTTILSVKLNKGGVVYTLPVSNDAGYINLSKWKASSGPDWPKIIRAVLLCAGVFAGVFVVYKVVKAVKGKGHGGRR